jgi:hypothetical protein
MNNIKYGKYNSTVKTVSLVCQQASHGHYISDYDLEYLDTAISELHGIYDSYLAASYKKHNDQLMVRCRK